GSRIPESLLENEGSDDMAEIPVGLSFDQDEEGFILRNKSADGSVTAIKVSAQELFGLKAQISLWIDRRMSGFRVESGSVQPIVVYPVAQVRLLPDAVQENVLLTVAAPSGEQMTLSFPLPVADRIAVELPDVLARMRVAKPKKQ